MKVVFFGTPDYVLPILKAVHKKFVTGPGKSPIVAVVTSSPKPVGRKQILSYSAVDKWAHDHKLPIFYSPDDLLEANLEFELGILASYGEIIKKEVINLFPQGILVVHPSLLPKFRWASPIPASIITNSNPTGVTIFKMDEKWDNGPIITQSKEEILPSDTTETLRTRLFEKSAILLTETIEPYLKGKIKPKKQNDAEATFARIYTKEEAMIPFDYLSQVLNGKVSKDLFAVPFIKGFSMSWDPANIDRFIRAMLPWPGAWTYLSNQKRLKLLKSHLEDGKLILDEVQLEGKDPVSYKQFTEAYPNTI